jgi:SSS family transporter
MFTVPFALFLFAEPTLRTRLSVPDLVLVAVYLVGITLFGLRFRQKQRDLRSYFLSTRDIPWWAISLSMVAAETSTLTIVGIPALSYLGDFGFLQIVFGYILGRAMICILFLPRYFHGDMLTAYQLIDRRFGERLHKLTAGMFLLVRAAAEGVRVFAVSIVIGLAIGTGDILSIVIICILTFIYTLEGGMNAVIWTDVVQMGLYILGTIAGLATLGIGVHGGWPQIIHVAAPLGKFTVVHFAFSLTNAYTFWAGLIGGGMLTMASHGTDQLMVQRLLAAKNLRESRIALMASGGIVLFQFALFLLIGVGLFVFYQQFPQHFASTDRIFPTFIVQRMPMGISGLLVAAVLAAAMSNLSAALNSLSSTSVIDFYLKIRPKATDREYNSVARIATLFWTLALLGLAILSRSGGHVVEIGIAIVGVAFGAMLGVFLLGTLTKRATETGAIVGMIVGFILNIALWLQHAPLHLGNYIVLPVIAYPWYVPVGSMVTFAVGYGVSLMTKQSVRTTVAILAVLMLASTRLIGQASIDAANPNIDFSNVDKVINDSIALHHLPGAVLVIGHGGHIVYEKAYGDRSLIPTVEPMTTDTIFDMASLTKTTVTAVAVMQLVEKHKINVDDPVEKYIPEFAANGKDKVTIRMLMTHYSGLPPDLNLKTEWSGKETAYKMAFDSKLISPPGSVFRYSDINYITLGAIVERISHEKLDAYVMKHIIKPLGLKETRYLPPTSWLPRIAPTEYDTNGGPNSTGTIIHGYVHDPTAHRMGGVAGHAGLFMTAADAAIYDQALLDRLAGRPSKFPLSQAMLLLMTTPQQPAGKRAARGLGWDIDSPYSGPRGKIFPIGSFGHTGFTGTSMWMDPGSNTYIILLSNRVHPHATYNITPMRGEVATDAALDLHLYQKPVAVLNGIDVLEQTHFAQLSELAAKHGGHLRLGLLTNQSGLDRNGKRTVDILHNDAHAANSAIELTTLFSPEHGLYGAEDHTGIGNVTDKDSGLPVLSLYGTGAASRRPTPESFSKLDAVVVDLQDVGVRFYTYETATGYFVEAAAKAGIDLIILDRPNPINGNDVQGPISDDGHQNYTDYTIEPIRQGLTLGELAMFDNLQNNLGAHITVVKMQNWTRNLWFDQTGLPWINPSPNLHNVAEEALYPGLALMETANVSLGRGTSMPFEVVGATWIDGAAMAAKLNARHIPGVIFSATKFTPDKPYPYASQECGGIKVTLTNRDELDAPELGLEMVTVLAKAYPTQFHLANVKRLLVNAASMQQLMDGVDPRAIAAGWKPGIDAFKEKRKTVLLY